MAPDTDHGSPNCQGCPSNKAVRLARNEGLELQLCECCALAHDEADGWTVTRLQEHRGTR